MPSHMNGIRDDSKKQMDRLMRSVYHFDSPR